jgi:hypothetical protein
LNLDSNSDPHRLSLIQISDQTKLKINTQIGMNRSKQRFDNFEQALLQLREALLIANPSIMTQNPMYELDRRMQDRDIRMKLKDDNKMKMGGKLKPVDKTKKPGLSKLPTAVRNKMGFKKNGGTMSKKK